MIPTFSPDDGRQEIQKALDKASRSLQNVEWMEKVSDKRYQARKANPEEDLIHVQRQSLLRCECDIAACPDHDRAARSNRTRRADRDPLLRHLHQVRNER